MANNYEQIMAIVNAGNKMGLSNTITRDNGIPLDLSSIHNSYNAAIIYAAERAIAYHGQPIAVVTETDATLYVITPTSQGTHLIDGKSYDIYLKQVGSSVPVDESSIVIDSGKLTIAGFGAASDKSIPRKTADGSLEWITIDQIVNGDGNTKTIVASANESEITVERTYDEDSDTYTYTIDLVVDIATVKSDLDTLKAVVGNSESGLVKELIDTKDALDAEIGGLKVSIEQRSGVDYIVLYDKDNTELASADASRFVKDSFLNDVYYDSADNKIKFTWAMADGSTKTDEILASDFVQTYSAGTGVLLSNNEFSIDTTVIATVDALNAVASSAITETQVNEKLKTYAKAEDINTALGSKIDAGSIQHATADVLEGVTVSGTTMKIVVDAYKRSEVDDLLSGVRTSVSDINTAVDNLTTKVDSNSDKLTGITTTVTEYVENAVQNIVQPKSSDEISVGTDGTLSLANVSTDKLTQGEQTLVIDGGNADS